VALAAIEGLNGQEILEQTVQVCTERVHCCLRAALINAPSMSNACFRHILTPQIIIMWLQVDWAFSRGALKNKSSRRRTTGKKGQGD